MNGTNAVRVAGRAALDVAPDASISASAISRAPYSACAYSLWENSSRSWIEW